MTRRISTLQDITLNESRDVDSKYDNVKTVADNINVIVRAAEGTEYTLKYLGASSTVPTNRLDGTLIEDGDYYFNTANGVEGLLYYDLTDGTWGEGSGGAVASVNGQVGVVTLTKTDLQLSNVDNISDANKQISIATNAALANKMDTSVQAAIDANTDKISNVDHPLVEIAVPLNAKLTDTTYTVGDGGLTEKSFTTLEKTKLGTIDSGAQINAVDSVNGQTGVVVVTKSAVGLDQVANALAIPATEKGAISGVASLDGLGKVPTAQLPATAPAVHTHTKSEVTDFNGADYATALQGTKADTALQPGDVPASTGEANTATSVGAGSSVVNAKVGVNLPFKSFIAGSGVSIDVTADTLTFNSTASGGGEVNTSSSLGAGETIVAAKSGANLPFKSLVGGSNVTLSSDANTVTINAASGTYDDTALWTAVNLNTVKDTNVSHPTVGKEVPSNAVFTDTTYANLSEFVNGPGFIVGITAEGIGSLSDVDLTGISNGKILEWDGLKFSPADKAVGGATTFTGLSDTPTNFTGSTSKILQSDGSQLVFVDMPVGTVTGVFGRTGAVTAEVTDYSLFYATIAQGTLAGTATQPNDNLSTLNDDIGIIPSSEKGAVNGIATLDANSKVPAAQLPNVSITDTSVVANQIAMLALTAETGDVAVRTDLNKTFILQGVNSTVLGDWQELLTPTDTITSVAGKTGTVTLTKADLTDFVEADYATGAEGELATSSIQPSDNISTLTNDSLFITLGDIPAVVDTVIPHTGGGTLTTGGVENQVRDSGAYIVPAANSVAVNTVCLVTLPDTYSTGRPTLVRSATDVFKNSVGEDTSINILGSVTLTLTSDGENKWFVDTTNGSKGADGISTPTEIVTEMPGIPTVGTLYIQVPV